MLPTFFVLLVCIVFGKWNCACSCFAECQVERGIVKLGWDLLLLAFAELC